MTALLQQPRLLAALILALVLVVGIAWRLIGIARARPELRPQPWRTGVLIVFQLASAWLFLQMLWPPSQQQDGDTAALVVATSPLATSAAIPSAGHRIAMPEAGDLAGFERMPDLATALRRWPSVGHVEVLGAGLSPRDLDAVKGRRVTFAPSTPPPGIHAVAAQPDILEGMRFGISGEASPIADGIIELLDPADRVVVRQDLARDGRFSLETVARASGPARFRLRLRRGDTTLDNVDVPLQVRGQSPASVFMATGGPAPETRFLARWALDNKAKLHNQVSLGGGMQAGDAPLPLDAATLAKFDLAVIDERVWNGLGGGPRAGLLAAVRNGLGLLVRVSGPLSGDGRGALRSVGFEINGDGVTDFALQTAGPVQQTKNDGLRFNRGAGSVQASGGVLLRDAHGTPVAAWRGIGRGRMAVWLPIDTFQLAMSDDSQRFAELWTQALNVLARPGADPIADTIATGWLGERIALCDLTSTTAGVTAADGQRDSALRDPTTGSRRCAGYWPRVAGWHQLEDGASLRPFFIRDPADAPGLHAWQRMEATRLLAEPPGSAANSQSAAKSDHRGWPQWWWFLLWLGVTGALWWFERSRIGRR